MAFTHSITTPGIAPGPLRQPGRSYGRRASESLLAFDRQPLGRDDFYVSDILIDEQDLMPGPGEIRAHRPADRTRPHDGEVHDLALSSGRPPDSFYRRPPAPHNSSAETPRSRLS